MKLYEDILTGDGLFTDVYKMNVVDDIIYDVYGKIKTETTTISESMIGGNKSQEDQADECSEHSSVSGCDIVIANNLRELYMDKKLFKSKIKAYIGAIVKHLNETKPERLDTFKPAAKKFVLKVLEDFDTYQFFTGESNEGDDGGIVLMHFPCIGGAENDGFCPVMRFFKDGLREQKL